MYLNLCSTFLRRTFLPFCHLQCRAGSPRGPRTSAWGTRALTVAHTSVVDVAAPFIRVSSDWEADGASGGPTLQVCTVCPSVRPRCLVPRINIHHVPTAVNPPLPPLFHSFVLFLVCFSHLGSVFVAASMQPQRRKERRRTWTSGQLLLYHCTLYLIVAFSRELKSCAAGKE